MEDWPIAPPFFAQPQDALRWLTADLLFEPSLHIAVNFFGFSRNFSDRACASTENSKPMAVTMINEFFVMGHLLEPDRLAIGEGIQITTMVPRITNA